MSNVFCGAKTRSGMPCKRLVVALGERCLLHGALNTGPRTLMGKAKNGSTLRLYRINPPKGIPKSNKAKLRRARRAQRIAMMLERQERQELRRAKWQRRQRIKSGLPLIDPEQE